jgi:hypothetical protein
MTPILNISDASTIEVEIDRCKQSHPPKSDKEGDERFNIYGFVRDGHSQLDFPFQVWHADKPDFIIESNKLRIGLESLLLTTQGLEHAERIRDANPGIGLITTSVFATENIREAKVEVFRKMHSHLSVQPPFQPLGTLWAFWAKQLWEELNDKVGKRLSYSTQCQKFGILITDKISYDFNEMKSTLNGQIAALRQSMIDNDIWVIYFRHAHEKPGILLFQTD